LFLEILLLLLALTHMPKVCSSRISFCSWSQSVLDKFVLQGSPFALGLTPYARNKFFEVLLLAWC
jgi:hypothetical protein